MDKNTYDITIIGAGPAGMYGAFHAGMRKMKVKIIDTLPQVGGQLATLYPEKYIYDMPGFNEIKAGDMIERLNNQMTQYNEYIDIVLNEQVDHVERCEDDELFQICTNKGCHFSRTVLITAGKGAFSPRKLDVENEEKFSNISYSVTKMKKYYNKDVVIFGGGDSAVDWANMLSDISKSVTIIHRRDTFRAHPSNVDQMRDNGVNIFTPYSVDSVKGDSKINEIVITNSETKETKIINVDEVIVLFGYLSSLGPIKDWDLEIENNSLTVDSKQETSVNGIYAAGDACTYDGKIKIITSGFGEVTTAVNSAFLKVNPTFKGAVFSSVIKK